MWLVIAISTFYAAFPIAYSRLLLAFYLPLVLAILLFVFRAVSLEFSYSGRGISRIWLGVFSLSSFLAATAGIGVISLVVSGIPTTPEGELLFPAASLLHPFALSFTLTGIFLITLHALAYLVPKTDGPLTARIIRCATGLWAIMLVMFLSNLLLLLGKDPTALAKPLVLAGMVTILAGMIVYRITLVKRAYRFLLICSSLAVAGLWLMVTGLLFPNIINPVHGDSHVLTVYNTSAPTNSLILMVLTSVVGIAIVGGYTACVYRAFAERRGK
ncbi:MAG: hypothetical protein A2X49_13010 [Lentisphaerae bacterium GWF2_52_8]|nr:MAG: hypothetical protein A2X49_13010 [Lentisphaerae bacterium GWF2_52_8]